jgi:acyl carrier protein
MSEEEILSRLTAILRDLLDDQTVQISSATKRADIPNWDSFAYVNFIVATELQFGVKFKIADVESFSAVGDIVHEIQALAG